MNTRHLSDGGHEGHTGFAVQGFAVKGESAVGIRADRVEGRLVGMGMAIGHGLIDLSAGSGNGVQLSFVGVLVSLGDSAGYGSLGHAGVGNGLAGRAVKDRHIVRRGGRGAGHGTVDIALHDDPVGVGGGGVEIAHAHDHIADFADACPA